MFYIFENGDYKVVTADKLQIKFDSTRLMFANDDFMVFDNRISRIEIENLRL